MTYTKEQMDAVYAERNKVVALLAHLVMKSGFKVGVRPDMKEGPGWHVLYIDTPTGQLSWHFTENELPLLKGVPLYELEWDKHTTEEKYERMRRWVENLG